MRRLNEFIIVFGFGGIAYSLIEVLFRGHTHWTMLLTGGAVFYILYIIFNLIRQENIFRICIAGGLIITTAEFIAGCVLNLYLKMNVWNYSGKDYNLFGQICPDFSIGWFALSVPVFYFSILLRRQLGANL